MLLIELEIEDINSVWMKKDGEVLFKKLINKFNRTSSRFSMFRILFKYCFLCILFLLYILMLLLILILCNNFKGSGFFD